jgi:hypothetical protein
VICIDNVTYAVAMRVLRSVEWAHPEANEAADRLQIAGIESATRDIEFNSEAPALCRAQAD